MFTNEIAIYGDYGVMADRLKEIGLFERILDVYICGAVVGMIMGRKGEKRKDKNSVKIFAGQLNNEIVRLRYLASVAYMIDNSDKKNTEEGEDELLRNTFGDWFGVGDEKSKEKYNLLYEAFGWELPTYVHLPMIMGKNEDGSVSKLSKRHGSTGFSDLVNDGYLPEAIINYIALLGWCPKDNQEVFTLQGLAEHFSIDGISKSQSIFDYDKLTWLNGEYLRAMTLEQFTQLAMPSYKQVFPQTDLNWEVLSSILQPRVTKLNQIADMIGFFKELPEYSAELFVNKKSKTNLENSVTMLEAAIPVLERLDTWTVEAIHDTLLALPEQLEVKNGTLLWPVRIAAAGMTVTPGGAIEILAILGKEETLRRLNIGLEKLKAENKE